MDKPEYKQLRNSVADKIKSKNDQVVPITDPFVKVSQTPLLAQQSINF